MRSKKKTPLWATLWSLILVVILPGPARAQMAIVPASGDGLTTQSAYQISELENLVWLKDEAYASRTDGKYYKLMQNIDATSTRYWNYAEDHYSGFRAIGNRGIPFNGRFLGQGFSITGLYISDFIYLDAGLFSSIGSQGEVRDLILVDCNVEGGRYTVGGLVGYNNGVIRNCSVTGTILATEAFYGAGGLVGQNIQGKVYNSVASCQVTGGDAYGAGGLVGANWVGSVVSNCYANSLVSESSHRNLGALVGYNNGGAVLDCFANGTVTGQFDAAGGLVGLNLGGTISRCYTSAWITGNGTVGGLAGKVTDNGTVNDSYWNMLTSGLTYSAGGTGATNAQMKQGSTFNAWDFESVWGIEGGYPYLKNLPTSTQTYAAQAGGQVADEVTTGSCLTQVVNIGATGTPVRAIPSQHYAFLKWEDEVTSPVRTDTAPAADQTFTALFDNTNGVLRWTPYE